MNKVKTYEEFINEGFWTKTIGGILTSLLLTFPNPTKAGMMWDVWDVYGTNRKPTLDNEKGIFHNKQYQKYPVQFQKNLDDTYRTISKLLITNQHNYKGMFKSSTEQDSILFDNAYRELKSLYDKYENDSNFDPTDDIKKVMTTLIPIAEKSGADPEIIKIFNKLSSGYKYDTKSIMIDYNIVYQKIQDTQKQIDNKAGHLGSSLGLIAGLMMFLIFGIGLLIPIIKSKINK